MMNSARLHKKLKKDTWFKRVLGYAEEKPNISGTAAILVFVLLAHFGTTVISGFIGFLYPAYKTLSLFHHPYDLECWQKWMIYWFLYSALNFIEMICLFSLDRIPTYWIIKCFFLAWCYAPPLQANGTDFFHLYLIRPFFQNQKAIANAISHVIKTAHCVYSDSEPIAFDGIHTDSQECRGRFRNAFSSTLDAFSDFDVRRWFVACIHLLKMGEEIVSQSLTTWNIFLESERTGRGDENAGAVLRSCLLVEGEGQELRLPEDEGSSSFVYENEGSSSFVYENEGSSSFVYENDSSSVQNEGWIFFPEIGDIICEPESDGGQDDPVDELSESEVSNVVRIGGATNDAAAIAASDYVWF